MLMVSFLKAIFFNLFMRQCIIGAMSCELEKIREIYRDKMGEPEVAYILNLNGEIAKVEPNFVKETKHRLEALKDKSLSYYFVPRPGIVFPVYRLEKYDDEHYIFHTNVRNNNARLSSRILEVIGFDKYVNIGLSGALKEFEKEGDIVVPEKVTYFEFNQDMGVIVKEGDIIDLSPIEIEDSIRGVEITSNIFLNQREKQYFNQSSYNWIGVDMETYFLAKRIPKMTLIRMISDGLDKGGNYFLLNIDQIVADYNKKIESLESTLI